MNFNLNLEGALNLVGMLIYSSMIGNDNVNISEGIWAAVIGLLYWKN